MQDQRKKMKDKRVEADLQRRLMKQHGGESTGLEATVMRLQREEVGLA